MCASLQSRLLTRLWRWRLYIEGSCPVSEGPFGYSLPRQSCGEGAHSSRTWLLGGESSSSTPDLLACRRRLSQPPSPLLRLADTLHHHPQGRPFLTLSQHLHSCLSTHTHTQNKQPFMESLKKKNISKLAAQPCQSWNWILQGEKKALTHRIWERKWIYIFSMNWTARNRYTSAALNKRENACRVLQGNEWLALFVYASVMLLWPFLFMRAKLWAHPWLLFTR